MSAVAKPVTVVDLSAYRSSGVRVFAGRERGKKVRTAAALDRLDHQPDSVEVRIPDDVFSVNSSFFLGMFGRSIRTLGEDRFREKYEFVGKDIARVIEDGIKEALRSKSP
ncbi:MAG: hypothetical protein ACREX3_21530, partial [Gammaproteobacteria bacterium]